MYNFIINKLIMDKRSDGRLSDFKNTSQKKVLCKSLIDAIAVSYTHLTLPTNREV